MYKDGKIYIEIRPYRFVYLMTITILSWWFCGWLATLFVVFAGIDSVDKKYKKYRIW